MRFKHPRRVVFVDGLPRNASERLSLEDVFSKLPTGRFSLGDAASAIERDNGTTRVYVVKLVTADRIRKVGEDPEYDGRGRAPIVYEKPQ